MIISTKYDTKQRLFEMMNKVNRVTKLDEAILPKEKKDEMIQNFIEYANNYLELENDKPDVSVSYDPDEAAKMSSFGKFTPHDNKILVVATNRNLADILRTLAHEMVHYKQKIEDRLDLNSGDDGTDIENEANSVAAVMMREFGRNNPIIFE